MKPEAKALLAARIEQAAERDELVKVCPCRMCAIGNPYCLKKFGGNDWQFMQAIGG